MNACEHFGEGDDETFLLDDDNTKERKCSKCKIVLANGYNRDDLNWIQNGFVYNRNNGPTLSAVVDDQSDHLEDSPLLINDIYIESIRDQEFHYHDSSTSNEDANAWKKEFHCHDSLSSTEDTNAWKKLSLAAAFCFMFMMAELLGGYLAGSLAIMTDAAHLFSDFIGFLISLLAVWVGKKPPSKNMTFGYYRAEVIGALLSVLTIWLLAAIFSTLAINRIYHRNYEIEANAMIITASLGLAVNIIMGGILHGLCHSHSHSNSQHIESANNNMNVRAAAIHVLGDLLQSIGVLVAALIIKFCPNAEIADPICTLLFSLLVIGTTIRVGKDSLWFLIEGSPINTSDIMVKLRKIAGVKHIHSLHVWSLAPGKNAAAVHLAVDQYCDRDLLLKKATRVIQSQISVISCTVQIEAYNSELTNSCVHCQSVQFR